MRPNDIYALTFGLTAFAMLAAYLRTILENKARQVPARIRRKQTTPVVIRRPRRW